MLTTWTQYKKYSGCKIGGVFAVTPPKQNSTHQDRLFYLTAALEAPQFGAVQNYDGAGLSGGPLHNIAVYPKTMLQGSLFKLLNYLIHGVNSQTLTELQNRYLISGWKITEDGKLKSTSGQVIPGLDIRNKFSPLNGRVPRSGIHREIADRWLTLHHKVFADPLTYKAQQDFAVNFLLRYNPLPRVIDPASDPELDLALCVFYSFAVNAPAIARKAANLSYNAQYPRNLIRRLATNPYGNWKRRYARMRRIAQKSGLWPKELFKTTCIAYSTTL